MLSLAIAVRSCRFRRTLVVGFLAVVFLVLGQTIILGFIFYTNKNYLLFYLLCMTISFLNFD